jgi:ParB family chromosome partitioning protein
MPHNQTNGNLALTGFNDIFNAGISGEQVVAIALEDLHPPEFHPFQVNDDDSMTRLVKSVKQYGIREPGLARPLADGGYELLSGNRRKRACELAGFPTLPVVIRELDDDSAAIAMVDSNLFQREKILPSEKAWAYRVKLEALNHRGRKSNNPGELSVDILCEQTGESKNQIFRLIRLTELAPALSDMVDIRKLAFHPAVELSYLTRTEQAMVLESMAKFEVRPSVSQAQKLKRISKDGDLTADAIDEILSEVKKPQKAESAGIMRFREYFPADYSDGQMERVIVELLAKWKAGAVI